VIRRWAARHDLGWTRHGRGIEDEFTGVHVLRNNGSVFDDIFLDVGGRCKSSVLAIGGPRPSLYLLTPFTGRLPDVCNG
jgi:hypothetical protein